MGEPKVPSVCGYCRAERPDAEALRFHVIVAHNNGGFPVSEEERGEAMRREGCLNAPPEPLEKQLATTLMATLRASAADGANWVDPHSDPDSFGFDGHLDLNKVTEALMAVLQGGGWVLPDGPPARELLEQYRNAMERGILLQLAVRLFRVLILGNVILPESVGAMDWLRDWVDGNLRGHGPIGGPMIWPERLPGICNLLREWGFMPTPSIPPYVQMKPPTTITVAG